MSASEGNQADSHADEHAEAHDHGPPPPPEPKTPMWLPAVGALLFLSAGLAWALTSPPKEATDLSGIPAGSATAAPTTNSAPAATAPGTAPAATIAQPRQIGTTVVQPLPAGDKRRK